MPRLRRFILDLAVRGKLVEQDPSDEPTSKLLTRIQQHRLELIATGDMRPDKKFRSPAADEQLFEVPSGWSWAVADNLWDFETAIEAAIIRRAISLWSLASRL